MKLMKLKFSMFVALILSCAVVASGSMPSGLMTQWYETQDGRDIELSFRVWDNAYVEITGGAEGVPSVTLDAYSTIVIPGRIDIYPVRVIGDWAFCGMRNLKHVEIPSSVIHIGYGAFQGTGLVSVTIPSSVWSVGHNLEYEKLSSGSYAPFNGGTWGEWLMAYCNELYMSIYMAGGSVSYDLALNLINSYDKTGGAFANCKSLTEVIMEPCQKATPYACQPGYDLYAFPQVRSLGEATFKGCENLTTVSLPDDLTALGDTVFQDCKSLETFFVPADMAYVSGEAFLGCTGLKSFVVSEDNFDFAEYDGALYDFEYGHLVKVPAAKESVDTVEILDGVSSIGSYAFANCVALVDAVIPDGISLENKVEVKTNSSVRILGGYGMQESWYGNLSSNFNSVVDSIVPKGSDPSVLTQDHTVVQADCQSNKYVTLNGSSSFAKSRFADFIEDIEPVELRDEYRCTLNEVDGVQVISNFQTYTEIATGPVGLFKDCVNLKSVSFGADCRVVQNDTFHGCSALEDVAFLGKVEWIGNDAFYGCSALSNLLIPEGVRQVGYGAFSGCRKLKRIVFPGTLEAIGDVREWGIDPRSDREVAYSFSSNMNWSERFEFNSRCFSRIDELEQNGGTPSELSEQRIEVSVTYHFDSSTSENEAVRTESSVRHFSKNFNDYCQKTLDFSDVTRTCPDGIPASLGEIREMCNDQFTHNESHSEGRSSVLPTTTIEFSKQERKRCSLFAGCASLSNVTFLGNAPLCGQIASEICYGAPSRMTITLPMESTGWDDKYVYADVPVLSSGNSLSARDILSTEGHRIEYAFDEERSVAVFVANARPVAVPKTWLNKYGLLDAVTDNGKLTSITSNTVPSEAEMHGDVVLPRSLYSSYVLGLNPVDEGDEFKAHIEIVDGDPVITWEPELTPEEAAKRKYTVYGCMELGGEWSNVDEAPDEVKSKLRFFKVGVEMR